MKFLPWFLLTAWTVWTIVENGNLKPQDNIILWLLSVVSAVVLIVGVIELLVKK